MRDLVLCPGISGKAPVIIKTEVVERDNLTNFGHLADGKRLSDRPKIRITMPRVDALRKVTR
jgi:hypothetical protein